MKSRRYHITLDRHEENLSGLRCQSIEELHTHVPPFVPTVANVRETISRLFPGYTIDERWMTVAEQIRDGCELICFSIDVLPDGPKDELITWSVGFMEV